MILFGKCDLNDQSISFLARIDPRCSHELWQSRVDNSGLPEEYEDAIRVFNTMLIEMLAAIVLMRHRLINGKGTGWIPDLPSIRDYTLKSKQVEGIYRKIGVHTELAIPGARVDAELASLQSRIDLRKYCSPIEDQGSLGSCTANAGVGMIEYYGRKAYLRDLHASTLFLYKTTRNLLGWTGDTGAYLRSTMGALSLFGALPEEYWPYDVSKFDDEPPAFCYQLASGNKSVDYVRLDPPEITKNAILLSIKDTLAKGLPSMFGFTIYESIRQAKQDQKGRIPVPGSFERVEGGHAVMAVGYDDDMEVENILSDNVKPSKGAFLIRNSWGEDWGDMGYGYLPYDYVIRGIAMDWWTIIKADWVETGKFR